MTVANILLAWPNLTDTGTLSGGAWQPALPLSALQDRVIAHPARSIDTAAASTQFVLDLGRQRAARLIALAGHSCSSTARWRVTAAADAAFTELAYAGDWLPVWPEVYAWDEPEWEDEPWWDLRPSEDERGAFTALAWTLLPSAVVAGAWRVEIDDAVNPAGYVDVGRLVIAPAWQPAGNAGYGLSFGYETGTRVEASLGGTEYFDRRRPTRSTRFQLDWLDADERLRVLDLQREVGIDGEVFYCEDPDASGRTALRTAWFARLRTLTALEYPYYATHSAAFELTELI